MARAAVSPRRPQLDVAVRSLAAVAGGYAAAAGAAACMARFLPIARDQATMTGMLASFAIYAAIVVWAFADRSIARLWIGLAIVLAIMGGALWWSIATEGRL